jgi:hypothetical protein
MASPPPETTCMLIIDWLLARRLFHLIEDILLRLDTSSLVQVSTKLTFGSLLQESKNGVVKIYNTTSSLVRFEIKIIFF